MEPRGESDAEDERLWADRMTSRTSPEPRVVLLAAAVRILTPLLWVIWAVGWLVSRPVQLVRRRPRRSGFGEASLRHCLVKLPGAVRDDVTSILAGVAAEYHGRWRLGGIFRTRSYALSILDGRRILRRLPVKDRQPEFYRDERGWRAETVRGWFRQDAGRLAGHVATAHVAGNHELPLPGQVDDAVIITIRHRDHPFALSVGLACRTHGFVLRRAVIPAGVRALLTSQPGGPTSR